jgi:hypothetical protein
MLQGLLAFDTQISCSYPAGAVEAISREEYDKAMGWEVKEEYGDLCK